MPPTVLHAIMGVGLGLVSFFSFLLLRMMYVRCLMKICEKVSMSLWILLLRILRSNKLLPLGLCIVTLIHAIMIFGVELTTRIGVSDVCSMSNFNNFLVNYLRVRHGNLYIRCELASKCK